MLKMNRVSWPLILLCSLLFAAPVAYRVTAEVVKQSSTSRRPKNLTPSATFSSAANGGTKIVISKGGNIIGFESPLGYEHLGNGVFSEGYVLCYGSQNTYDTGKDFSGFLFPKVLKISPSDLWVSRKTSDGVLNLVQKFEFNPMKGQDIGISMTVKNLSTAVVDNVILRRQADLDIDSGGTKSWAEFNNRFAKTSADGVFAWNDQSDAPKGFTAHGLLMRTDKFSSSVLPKVTSDILDKSCSPTAVEATPADQRDVGATLEYNLGSIPAGGTKEVQLRYTRF